MGVIVLEYKLVAAAEQRRGMDEAIRTAQFVRNACLRYWMDSEKVGKNDIYKHTTKLRAEFEWAKKLNSTAVQAAGERAWASISRFYDNHKKGAATNVCGRKPVGSQYPTVSKNPVWDGEKRSIKASICTSRCFSGWLHARTNSLRPKVMTLHALLPWVLSRTLC